MYIKTNKADYKGIISTSKLLVESYWENGASKTKTVLNLNKLPTKQQLAIEQSLKDRGPKVHLADISVKAAIDYGHIAVVLEFIKRLRIEETLRKIYPENASLAVLMILGKVITRGSKLGIVNWIKRNEFIAQRLGVDIAKIHEKDLYAAMADLDNLQEKIEHKWNLYNRKKINTIYLYDITSLYFEGMLNELSEFGYDRDNKKGHKKIITAGLVTDSEGFPLKVEVFHGNLLDYKTVQKQIQDLKENFGANDIIFVGDRGMRIRYNLEEMATADKAGVKYISGLTTDEIRNLVNEDTIQLSLFGKELMEIEKDDKRYILCINPALAQEKQERRTFQKMKFETELAAIQRSYEKEKNRCVLNCQRLVKGSKNKNLKMSLTEKEIDAWKYRIRKFQVKYKMQNVYTVTLTNENITINYDAAHYEKLNSYDGKYVFETTVSKDKLNKEEVRDTYKRLQLIEHAFKISKTDKLDARPVFHRRAKQTRAHVFICMFAYAVIFEMENRLYPWLKEMKKTKDKLSYKDAMGELNNIKICILSFGKSTHQEIKITELSDRQKQIFKLLEIKESILV